MQWLCTRVKRAASVVACVCVPSCPESRMRYSLVRWLDGCALWRSLNYGNKSGNSSGGEGFMYYSLHFSLSFMAVCKFPSPLSCTPLYMAAGSQFSRNSFCTVAQIYWLNCSEKRLHCTRINCRVISCWLVCCIYLLCSSPLEPPALLCPDK